MSRFTYERDKLPFYLPSLKFHWRVAGCRLWERTANRHSCWMPTSLKENTSRIIVLISVESPVTTAFKMQRAAQSQLQTMANQFAICHRAIKQLHKRTETRRPTTRTNTTVPGCLENPSHFTECAPSVRSLRCWLLVAPLEPFDLLYYTHPPTIPRARRIENSN